MNSSEIEVYGYTVLAASIIGVGTLTYYMTKQSPPIIDKFYDFDHQTIEIDEKERIRVCKSIYGKNLIEYRFEDVRTLYDVLQKGRFLSGDGPCLGTREAPGKGPYKWISYSQVLEQVKYVGSGLIQKGFEPVNSTRIGIYSSNRNEWIISEHACYSFSLTVVSLYDSYGRESIKYILNHAEIQAIFVDSFIRLTNILEVANQLTHLKLVVYFNELKDDQFEKIDKFKKSVEIISFKDLMNIGKSNIHEHHPPKPSDIATICYTSGTTGVPKGAMISHANIISNEAAIYERLHRAHIGYSRDLPRPVHLSYLPLAHMLERQGVVLMFLSGGQMGFISGDVQNLMSDAQELKPTDVPLVPRILNKLFNQVKSHANSNRLQRIMFNRALVAKERDIKRGIYRKNTLYDKLVFNKIREKFGGRVIRIGTGSAPISDDVMIFSRAVFGCPLLEGYGQTESTCAITFTHHLDNNLGHVGAPIGCYMVKLIDVPDMDYYSVNNVGEICAKGPSRFQGYLKDEERTKEVIDEDGWLHTGDIGRWLPIFVDGNSLKDYLVAVVVPDVDYLTRYCQKNEIVGDLKDLCNNQEIKNIILKEITKCGKEAGLMSYEQAKCIHLHPESMNLQNGLATPTLKIKRFEVRKYFKDVINHLYEQGINHVAS